MHIYIYILLLLLLLLLLLFIYIIVNMFSKNDNLEYRAISRQR